MEPDNERKRGISWDAAVEGEANSVERWKQIVSGWNPFNRQLVRVIASIPEENRPSLANDFASLPSEPGDQDDQYLQFITDLAALSPAATERLLLAINQYEQEQDTQ